MTLQKGDKVAIKAGGRAAYTLSGGLVKCNNYAQLEAADALTVDYQDPDGDVAVYTPEGIGGLIARSQLLRVFAGGFREGDEVLSSALGITGVVVDRDPAAEDISRSGTVPVQVKTRGTSANAILRVGEVVYAEPQYIIKAKRSAASVAPPFPRVSLERFFGKIAEGQGWTGGQGGAGGSGAFGGRGGNGGNVHIHIPAGADIKPVQSNHDGPVGVDLNANQRAGLLGVEKPTDKPKYIDVTDKVKGNWANVELGDVVTATHHTQINGQQVSNSRTAEVAKGNGWWPDRGDIVWCELNLSMHRRYDAHKITKVLRLEKPAPLEKRRKPIALKVRRLVAAHHVWGPSYLTAEGEGFVEPNENGDFFVKFVDQKLSGNKLRLKEGRDTVEYVAITGLTLISSEFERLVVVTHSPA